ncbi:hypothetical protein NC653_014206 [Populus alba x Populus x berolinensis]|uniref:Uncharacterized protein n=1 Tax=Populus alba x Populus x berolinensis TaxID=444605 RepID=A0AAD6QWJ3_9ROSI|nr:hypothetical protein NC653_014206 [Populus alba x Populus x berolinensis]
MASQQITEEAVYMCTGNPLPKDIKMKSDVRVPLIDDEFQNFIGPSFQIVEPKIKLGAGIDRDTDIADFPFSRNGDPDLPLPQGLRPNRGFGLLPSTVKTHGHF